MKKLSFIARFCMTVGRLFAAGALAATAMPGHAQIALADQPLFTSVSVPGNVLLSLSVEYPTALDWAYPATTNPYTPATAYLGYFDPAKCYQYNYNSTTPSQSYFSGYSAASASHTCTSTASTPLWSGNWLNWTTMQVIDTFRWALTGGYRSTDTTTTTILERAWNSGQGGANETVDKVVPKTGNPASDVSGATPFKWSTVTSRVWNGGNKFWVTSATSSKLEPSPAALPVGPVDYNGQNSYSEDSPAPSSSIYAIYIRVKVCDPAAPSLEANCTQYGSNYKPEGLIQQNALKIRFGAFGYLLDASDHRDGGVLRAGMKYVGPLQPVPGSTSFANPLAEWSSVDGTFFANPNPADATASSTASGITIANSGVINYLNKFGETGSYKTNDPVSELYYAGIRYYKNLGNWSTYTANLTSAMYDGFPVIVNWVDPILYSCQKNFILGIGDVNTHSDANLPGSTIKTASETAATPNDDTTVNVKTATDMVGTLEGIANLGSKYAPSVGNSTYFMAGLAYDAHTKDIRPCDFPTASSSTPCTTPKSLIQTVSTYWLDVQEYQSYTNNNQFYLATKYGGFQVPANFQPYASTNAKNLLTIGTNVTTPMTTPMWHTNSDNLNATNPRPDNYFSGGQADKMVAGLAAAFADIVSQVTAYTTAFSTTSAQLLATNNLSYASQYSAASWTGDVIASTVSYDANNVATYNHVWYAQALLQTQASRKIITNVAGVGKPFEVANLSGTAGYTTFANVPGVASGSQSSANFLAYLRGNQSKETSQTGGVYRTRTFLLGDIVDSEVNPVGAPNGLFSDSANPGYGSFKTTYASRKTVVYVGANDGMMHAFDGSLAGGSELFAYIPGFLYGTATTAPVNGLASLGNPNYIHHYFVDGTPQVFDMDMNNTNGSSSSTPNWKSVLIGGLGKGGMGYYSIDVTDPTSWTSESAVAGKVLWEFTDSRMGYSYGDPVVVKTKKYGWVAILTSGFNNADGQGYFFFVNPATGALLEAVSTGVGTATNQSGLAYASAYVPDYLDGTADSIYAGDLLGNVWRLDLTPTSGSYAAPTQIATLTDSNGNAQPVTTRPLIEIQPNTFKRYVLIGTGQLLSDADRSSTQVQTFYAIVDGTAGAFYTAATLPTGVGFPITRSNLVANTDLTAGIGTAPASPMGWYFDLTTAANGVAARIDTTPNSVSGVVAFAANTPNGDVCNPSGTNNIYAVNFGTGMSVLTDGSGTVIGSTSLVGGVINDIQFFDLNNSIVLQVGNSQGNTLDPQTQMPGTGTIKRLNWRELPTTD